MEQVVRRALNRFAKPAARSRPVLVIVDMHDDQGSIISSRGSTDSGIQKIAEVISAAKGMHIPVLLITLPEYPRILQELLDAAGPDPRTMIKLYRSCFLDPEFAGIINELTIGTLILGGWKRNKCVLATAEHALQCGFGVMTSEDILFHGSEDNATTLASSERGFYREKTEFYETSGALIAKMEMRYKSL